MVPIMEYLANKSKLSGAYVSIQSKERTNFLPSLCNLL